MSSRTKILITIDWFLPGTKSGGPVRSYANMLDHLGAYFDFYVVTRDTDFLSNTAYSGIKSNSWNKINDYTEVYYFSKDALNSKNLKNLLHNTKFDVAYINGIYSWYFSILPILALKNYPNVLVSARGMLNPQAFSVKPLKKKVYLALANTLNLYKGVKFHATNTKEAEHIKSIIAGSPEVKIAANLPRKIKNLSVKRKALSQPFKFVNIARISKEKGTLKMIESLKDVETELILDIFGPIYDPDYWEKCQKAIAQLPNHISVNHKGFIESELVLGTIKSYDFFVLLSEGENFGHAILEALSVGCPVIISDKTPWRSLERNHLGWDIDITNQDRIKTAFENALNMTNKDYQEWSLKAYTYAKEFIENPEVLEQNKALFLEAN